MNKGRCFLSLSEKPNLSGAKVSNPGFYQQAIFLIRNMSFWKETSPKADLRLISPLRLIKIRLSDNLLFQKLRAFLAKLTSIQFLIVKIFLIDFVNFLNLYQLLKFIFSVKLHNNNCFCFYSCHIRYSIQLLTLM